MKQRAALHYPGEQVAGMEHLSSGKGVICLIFEARTPQALHISKMEPLFQHKPGESYYTVAEIEAFRHKSENLLFTAAS